MDHPWGRLYLRHALDEVLRVEPRASLDPIVQTELGALAERLHDEGLTYGEIAARLGVDPSTIYVWRTRQCRSSMTMLVLMVLDLGPAEGMTAAEIRRALAAHVPRPDRRDMHAALDRLEDQGVIREDDALRWVRTDVPVPRAHTAEEQLERLYDTTTWFLDAVRKVRERGEIADGAPAMGNFVGWRLPADPDERETYAKALVARLFQVISDADDALAASGVPTVAARAMVTLGPPGADWTPVEEAA